MSNHNSTKKRIAIRWLSVASVLLLLGVLYYKQYRRINGPSMTQVQKTFESNKADFERLKELINSEGAFTELRFTTGPGFPDLPENTANSEIKKLFEKLGVFQVERGGGLTKFSFHNTYSTSMFGWNDVGLCYAVSVNVDYRALMHGRYFRVYGIAPNWGVYQTSDSGFL